MDSISRNMKERGFTLIEILVALTIFAVGILGLVSMQGAAIATFSDAKYRADAALLADSLIGQIWVDRSNVSSYAYASGSATGPVASWLSRVQATLPSGTGTVAINGNEVTVTVRWQPPDAPAQRRHTAVSLVQGP